MKFTKFETLSIKDHPELGETWVQARIAEDPKSLGLGDIVLKDKERRQPRAGRLDLLLQDSVESRRYEVEVQLGQVDESHIIRTIEYWDIERRRYPQYEHTAVIIAEDITSRFLNIISLFNGMIPLVAIQMKALKSGDEVGLVFTTVVDQLPLGLVGEDEEIQESADRTYWEQRSSKKALAIVDELLNFTRIHDKELELKYNKFYIGLAIAGQANNFVIFRPRSGFLRLEPRLKNTPETQASLESAGLDVMDYDSRWGRYRIRLQPGDVTKYKEAIAKVIAKAYEESSRD